MPQSFHDDYMCQKCATVKDSGTDPSQWRPDITGNKSAGNVCPSCMKTYCSKLTPTEKSQEVLHFLNNKPEVEKAVFAMMTEGTPYTDSYFVVFDCLDALIIEATRLRDSLKPYQEKQ